MAIEDIVVDEDPFFGWRTISMEGDLFTY